MDEARNERWGITTEALRINCYAGTLAQAVSSMIRGGENFDRYWIGSAYLCENGSGSFGTIVFEGDQVIGMYFDHESDRRSFTEEEGERNVTALFAGYPEALRFALHYVLWPLQDRFSLHPIITAPLTAAFWSDGDHLVGAEPWDETLKHAYSFHEIAWEDFDDTVEDYCFLYSLSDATAAIVERICREKARQPDQVIALTPEEVRTILGERPTTVAERNAYYAGAAAPDFDAELTGDDNDRGVAIARWLLRPIGVTLPTLA